MFKMNVENVENEVNSKQMRNPIVGNWNMSKILMFFSNFKCHSSTSDPLIQFTFGFSFWIDMARAGSFPWIGIVIMSIFNLNLEIGKGKMFLFIIEQKDCTVFHSKSFPIPSLLRK